ncbi:peroxiredoxin [Elizabethkingia occulta]|uniref:Thioredoxin domain-containing protein n=1 Tax=Elizabethkingia occulta TaxID=1867263 RepID=A0A1T3MWR9_9FLAO|nr:thioredoxin family protein [Elizabethkingia occulta]OPC69014.1 hypothetical protein BAZ10_00280 [Elizabethkingia occulta]
MNRKFLTFIIVISGLVIIKSQNVEMNFPKFAGKSYDFILFQGDHQETVYQGIIPKDGKFTLSVPDSYGTYTGMSRWLITGTKEGGGLDMFIPGHHFSVSCPEENPSEKNIVYINNEGDQELNRLFKYQQEILSRYQSMLLASRSYDSSFAYYSIFKTELEKQKNEYVSFQRDLREKSDYISRFLSIANLTRGIGGTLSEQEEERGRDAADYISQNLDWKTLYTSGHWSTIIGSWISIHSDILKDPVNFTKQFKAITNRISSAELYTDFCGRVSYYLGQFGKDDYISLIAPVVISSGKIIHYEGSLSSYIRGTVGLKGSDLVLETYKESSKNEDFSAYRNQKDRTVKISDLAGSNYNQILLLFYKSDCGHCDELLRELSARSKNSNSKKIRIIGISSDRDKEIFSKRQNALGWKDLYCDYKGVTGANYKNYGITATPTLVLMDNTGTIIYRGASLKELQTYLKK